MPLHSLRSSTHSFSAASARLFSSWQKKGSDAILEPKLLAPSSLIRSRTLLLPFSSDRKAASILCGHSRGGRFAASSCRRTAVSLSGEFRLAVATSSPCAPAAEKWSTGCGFRLQGPSTTAQAPCFLSAGHRTCTVSLKRSYQERTVLEFGPRRHFLKWKQQSLSSLRLDSGFAPSRRIWISPEASLAKA